MPRLRDIDRELLDWDESKHPRDRFGRFTFSIGSILPNATLQKIIGKGDRIDQLMKLDKKATKLGVKLGVLNDPKDWDLYTPELAVQGLYDAKEHGWDLPKEINIVEDIFRPEVAGTYWSDPDDMTIDLNTISPAWDDPDYGIMNKLAGWWSAETPLGVVHHELAHHEHNRLLGNDEFNKLKAIPIGKEDSWRIADEVGIYAATKTTEFVAEVAAGHMNGENYSDYIKSLYQAMGGPRLLGWDD